MAAPSKDPPGGPDAGSRERRARRERLRRRIRMRRRLAGGALVLAAGLAGAGALLLAGGGGQGSGSAAPARPRASPSRRRAAGGGSLVRTATPQPGWSRHTGPVPILEYHVLGPPDPEAPYPGLYVTRRDFHRQMDWLDEHGYQAVTLEAVERAWYQGGELPARPVVLTFDDGYRPDFTYALPELRRHGWPGVIDLKAEGSDLYTSNVQALLRAGWELAAHTIHHLDLTELDAARLREEVAGSRRMLQREYGAPVRNFCYPSGRFDAAVVAAVRAAGYTGATTEIPGLASRRRPYVLALFVVLGEFGVAGLRQALRCASAA
jgi:peptidoglycan/xylan/chitin deacetylase (PgdA/CDA1 family)